MAGGSFGLYDMRSRRRASRQGLHPALGCFCGLDLGSRVNVLAVFLVRTVILSGWLHFSLMLARALQALRGG